MSHYGSLKVHKDSLFLKIEQGLPHTVRLLDESPTEEFQHNVNQKLVKCDGDQCGYCDEGHSRKQRFITNVYDHTQGRVVLWSFGGQVAEFLKNIANGLTKDGADIMDHDLEVSAQGTGLQKKTSVQVRIKSLPVPTGIKKHTIGKKAEIPF